MEAEDSEDAASEMGRVDTMLPDAIPLADPFHVVRLANQCLDERRDRVPRRSLRRKTQMGPATIATPLKCEEPL